MTPIRYGESFAMLRINITSVLMKVAFPTATVGHGKIFEN
jgi:hypothetical protein